MYSLCNKRWQVYEWSSRKRLPECKCRSTGDGSICLAFESQELTLQTPSKCCCRRKASTAILLSCLALHCLVALFSKGCASGHNVGLVTVSSFAGTSLCSPIGFWLGKEAGGTPSGWSPCLVISFCACTWVRSMQPICYTESIWWNSKISSYWWWHWYCLHWQLTTRVGRRVEAAVPYNVFMKWKSVIASP